MRRAFLLGRLLRHRLFVSVVWRVGCLLRGIATSGVRVKLFFIAFTPLLFVAAFAARYLLAN